MNHTREDVIKALSFVTEPGQQSDIVSLNQVNNIKIESGIVSFDLGLHNPAMHNRKNMGDACEHQIQRFLGKEYQITINAHPVKSKEKSKDTLPPTKNLLPDVKNIIAVASGKGGVGKSTIAANLAVGLAARGYKVGMVDADIYGPSIPLMFDVVGEKPAVKESNGRNMIVPVESYGVKVLSIGFFADTDQAVVWRGPMASKALQQMFADADWGALDYMIIDLPPGTGDIHLSLVQSVPITGAVVVSTPQEMALIDARKAIGMFNLPQINVPVLGLIENMSYFTPEELPDNKYYIFGKEGTKNLAEKLTTSLLGQIPIVQSIRESADVGRPAILQENTSQSSAFKACVENILKQTDLRNTKAPTKQVEITTMDGCAEK